MLIRSVRGKSRHGIAWLLLGALGFSSLSGCSRQFWRKQADKDSYNAIAERMTDPHWQLPRMELTPDPRSRFFDPYDPDKAPLPPDDPAAHEFMHCVNGRKGYKNWHKLGTSLAIENPQWLDPYGIQVSGADPVLDHSKVKLEKLTMPNLMDLAYIHSRDYQTAIERLYLSALDLTAERFRLGVRFLGVRGIEPGASVAGRTNSRGEASGNLSGNFGVSQLLPTGGQMAVELANSVTWVFGSGGGVSAPTLGYSVTQPLLFNAGRKVILEDLTQSERSVLYEARTVARFRQTIFADVATQYLSLVGRKQAILNVENNIRLVEEQIEAQAVRDSRPTGIASEPLEELPDGFQIPDELQGRLLYEEGWLKWRGPLTEADEAILKGLSDDPAYQAASEQLIAWKKQRATALASLQLIGNRNNSFNTLTNNRRLLSDDQDTLKLTLGLPPNVDLTVDESLLSQFELISMDLIDLEKKFRDVQTKLGEKLLPSANQNQDNGDRAAPPDFDAMKEYVATLGDLRDELEIVGIEKVQGDFEALQNLLQETEADWQVQKPGLRFFREETEREALKARLVKDLQLFQLRQKDFRFGSQLLDMMTTLLDAESQDAVLRKLDTSGNGIIELDELPKEWESLPRQGIQKAQLVYTIPELLIEIRDASRVLRDKYLLSVAQGLEVVQAGLRVELIAINPFTLDGSTDFPDIERVIELGIENRHDLMNARAQVMDARRQVEIAANLLEASMSLRFSGTEGIAPGARSQTNHNATLQFTTPMDRVLERNIYREALVAYQQERRAYMLLEDTIKQRIRIAWRQLQVQEIRLDIDRASVRNAALQYENTSLQAGATQNTGAAGGGGGGGQNNALNLLQALNSVLTAQNSLVQDWTTYETNRLNIFRDMGIMEIDPRGVWTDPFYQQMDNLTVNGEVSPPAMTPEVVPPAPGLQN